MADQKTLDRVEKLLRLAAPSSNSTIEERSSAALRAAELIAEHGLTIGESSSKRGAKASVVSGAWVRSVALDYCSCSACHTRISPRDIVWIRVVDTEHGVKKEFRHNYGSCAVA